MTRRLKIIRLFGEYRSLLQGSFAKETYTFKEPTSGSHPIGMERYVYLCGKVGWCGIYVYTGIHVYIFEVKQDSFAEKGKQDSFAEKEKQDSFAEKEKQDSFAET